MEATGSGRGGCRCRLQPVFTTAHQSQPSANSHFNPISVPPSPYLHLRRVLKMCVQICNAYHQVSGRNPVNLLLVSARTDKYSTRALYFLGPARTGTWQGPGGAPTVWQALNAGEQCAFTLPAPLLPRDAQPQPQQREAAREKRGGNQMRPREELPGSGQGKQYGEVPHPFTCNTKPEVTHRGVGIWNKLKSATI